MEVNNKDFDVFICHASQDKKNLVGPLAAALSNSGYRVWFDEFTVSVGDGLRRSIDKGIANSRFGIVVISKAFFDQRWTNYELDGLTQLDIANPEGGSILPIWYGINKDDVLAFSPSLADRFAICTDGSDIERVVKELEKKIGDYYYSVNGNGKIIRSQEKVNIDVLKRDKKFQLITNHLSHRLFNKEKCVITAESVIYPYSKDFNTLKFGHWQSNKGTIELVRHVAYDFEQDVLLTARNEILKNDGSNFLSAVEFKRQSDGPVRVICEIMTTNLYKSLFLEGSDEVEASHPLRIEHYSFSLFLPNREDFSNLKVYVDGVQSQFIPAAGGRLMKHEIFGTSSVKTIYSFVDESLIV